MTTDKFCFYLKNRLIQTSKTGGEWYSDTSPFSNPWFNPCAIIQCMQSLLYDDLYGWINQGSRGKVRSRDDIAYVN
jgi:hypothetical protein